jgi:hypothetical protein
MFSASTSIAVSSSAVFPASEIKSEQKPEEPVEIIPIEGDYFISSSKYNYVADREQATRDWIRHQDGIYLNGFSLRIIVDNLKKEYLKELIDHFLYADEDPVIINKRLAALREFVSQFFGNAEDMKFLTAEEKSYISDSLSVKLLIVLREIFFNLDITNESKKPKYHFNNSDEMQLLRALVKKCSRYFSTDGIAESCDVLNKIWDDYLFFSLTNDDLKREYAELFFSVVHHGGALFSLFTAHLQHINPLKYFIRSDPCIEQSRINFTSTEENIYIRECTPILLIGLVPCIGSDGFVEDEDEAGAIRNANNSNVMETVVTHAISLNNAGKAVLRIKSAYDYSYNSKAREILLDEWFKLKQILVNYANNYIHYGHNLLLTTAVFETCPWIKASGDDKPLSPFRRMFTSKDKNFQGDKILLCLGKCFPSYAENILVDLVHYAEFGKKVFLRTVKLLKLMGRNDLANKAILPYLTQAHLVGHINQLDNYKHDNEKNHEAAYKYMISAGFLAPVNTANGKKVPEIKPLIIPDDKNNISTAAASRIRPF